ncbi:MAG: hypothetical protein LC114_00900, partial [Bryobacterales bacterium]|nr:hypothetical protein [Bryobacterales bacterium]
IKGLNPPHEAITLPLSNDRNATFRDSENSLHRLHVMPAPRLARTLRQTNLDQLDAGEPIMDLIPLATAA